MRKEDRPPRLEKDIQEQKDKAKKRAKEYGKTYNKRNIDKIKNNRLKITYSITLDDFNLMLKNQNNKCLGCSDIFIESKDINVDYNHKTGKVRGLLCRACNHALGNVKDNINILKSLISYLEYNN